MLSSLLSAVIKLFDRSLDQHIGTRNRTNELLNSDEMFFFFSFSVEEAVLSDINCPLRFRIFHKLIFIIDNVSNLTSYKL